MKSALDAVGEGIVFPLVTTEQSAAGSVALTRYPPQGQRGRGPFVARSRWGTALFGYLGQRGGETVCALLIETRTAIGNIEEICQVEGIDRLTIAPFGLSTEMGVSGNRLLWRQFDVLILRQFVRQAAEWRSVHAPGLSR